MTPISLLFLVWYNLFYKFEMTNSTRNFLSFVLVLAIVGGIFYYSWQNYGGDGAVQSVAPNITHLKIGSVFVEVESVSDSSAQARGLSGREGLGENKGMLFIFPKSGIYPFWMKDMKFPIDIVWISEFGRVVHIKHNATPESYPDLFVSEDLAKYVLEVPTGFAEKHNLMPGDTVEFLRQ